MTLLQGQAAAPKNLQQGSSRGCPDPPHLPQVRHSERAQPGPCSEREATALRCPELVVEGCSQTPGESTSTKHTLLQGLL